MAVIAGTGGPMNVTPGVLLISWQNWAFSDKKPYPETSAQTEKKKNQTCEKGGGTVQRGARGRRARDVGGGRRLNLLLTWMDGLGPRPEGDLQHLIV